MAVSPKIHAILTGDIVNSSRLLPREQKLFLDRLNQAFGNHPHEYYRGDSFQVYIDDPRQALKVSLQCRATAISFAKDYEASPYDVRISIGVGTVNRPMKILLAATGEAFLLSGRNLDEISNTNIRLIIVTGNELANAGLAVLTDYINSIFEHMTPKQAEIISGLLAGNTQQSIAQQLSKSKSTVHQLTVSGRWQEIEKLLQRFENLINYLL